MNPQLIRPATEADVSIIRHLAHEIWPVAYGEILSPAQLEYMLDLFYSEESLKKQMAEGQHFFLLYEPEAVGFAAVGPVGGEAFWKLHKLYVLSGEQGKGLGRKLLHFVEEYARKQGATEISLQVNRHNRAKDFYKANGFYMVAEKDFDIGGGFFMNDFILKKTF